MKRSGKIKRSKIKVLGRKAASQKELGPLFTEALMLHWGIGEFTDAGKKQWYGACLRCRKPRWLQCSHIYPKGKYPRARFHLKNAIPLCAACHIYWWHKHPIAAAEWIRETMGADYMDRLRLIVETAGPLDIEGTRLFLTAEVKRLRSA